MQEKFRSRNRATRARYRAIWSDRGGGGEGLKIYLASGQHEGTAICPEQRWYGDINIRFVELCSCLFGVSGKSASYV